MNTPDYIKILKLDKLALKAKSHAAFALAAQERLPYARNIGVGGSFQFFVERAWLLFGTGE